ncbi:MAG: membrane protein insertase YidC [Bryobacteraceae bacterium]
MTGSPTNSNPSSPSGTPGPKKPLSMETRLLLAFLLMGLVLFVTPYLYKPPVGPKRTEPAPTAKQAAQVAQKAPEAVTKTPPGTPLEMPGQIAASAEREFVIDTDLYRIKLANRGAVVRSWELKKFKDHTGKPLQLVNTGALSKVPPPFSVSMPDDKTAVLLNYALFVEKRHPDGLGVDYEFSDGKTVCRKSFQFGQNSYMSQFTSEVTQNGTPVRHLIEWRGGFGDPTVLNRVSAQHSVYYDVSQSKLLTKDAKSAKDGAVTATGNYSFAGLDDTFFAFVLLPNNASTEVRTVRDEAQSAPTGKEEPHVGVEIGGDSQNKFDAFVGPKDVDILKHVDPKLQQLIDWGWFWFVAQPLFAALHYINDHIMHNYGWSIVLITIIINLLLLPLRFTSLKSARKMQALQPQIAAINAKYKNLSLRDPKKAEQNQEVMDLYKKHGANPLGGCLPMVIQLPILYGFYKVLSVTIEMRNAPWLWVADLSQPEQLPLHLLPIIMIITQFIMQKMTPNPSMDPAQAKMMQFMPLMFGFFFYNMSSGLVLYWLTGNLVGILQQYLINKYTPAPVIATPKPALKKAIKR